MNDFEHKCVYVLGAGASGIAAARLAHRQGADVVLVDGGDTEHLRAATACLADAGIAVELGWKVPAETVRCDLCVASPGIPLGSPMSDYFAGLGCPVMSELEFGGKYCPWPKLAVTGTNGKTTVVEMLSHCLAGIGKRVLAGGNIGLPLAQIALDKPELDVLVVEVSSFQMERTSTFETLGAALLNITPDHLVRHGTMEIYEGLKLRLLQQTAEEGGCVIRRSLLDEPLARQALVGRRVLTFAADRGDADFVVSGGSLCRRRGCVLAPVMALASLPFGGVHNYENCLAVLALGELYGVAPEVMAAPLASFAIGHHRMEVIRNSGKVQFVDDSKATNLDALVQSVRRFGVGRGDIALIAGGLDKGCDLGPAKAELAGRVKAAFLIGACRGTLAEKWGGAVPCVVCGSLEEAVEGAWSCVRESGGTVLLAPGCASQDMFRDYEERGRLFASAVEDVLKRQMTL